MTVPELVSEPRMPPGVNSIVPVSRQVKRMANSRKEIEVKSRMPT